MDKNSPVDGSGRRHRFPALRRVYVQIGALIALHSSWGPEAKWICNPVLSCHSCALSWFACPIGVFVHYSGYRIFPFLAVGMVLLVGVLVGRLLCGWVCPFGFLQDLLYKIPTRKVRLPAWSALLKYVLLVLLVVAFPFVLGEQTVMSFCRFCPASALQVTLPNMIRDGQLALPLWSVVKLLVLAIVVLLAIFSSRSFCKAFCPIGAMLAPLNWLSVWKVRAPAGKCVSCRKCDKICPTDAHPSRRLAVGESANRDPECIVCHECPSACSAD